MKGRSITNVKGGTEGWLEWSYLALETAFYITLPKGEKNTEGREDEEEDVSSY